MGCFSRWGKWSVTALRAAGMLLVLAFAVDANAALTSGFADGVLTIASDADDAIVVTCFDVRGVLFVRINGANPDSGQIACAALTVIVVGGGPSANAIDLGQILPAQMSALIDTTIDGGDGDDSILGSFVADQITGGKNDDVIDSGAGDDAITWNPGDNTDTVDGGDGNDSQTVNGGPVSELFTIGLGVAQFAVRFTRSTQVAFDIDLANVESLVTNANDGNDDVSAELAGTPLPAGLIELVLNGGAGNDSLTGSAGADRIDAGAGDDRIDPNPGDDLVAAGAGDDAVVWNNGDNTDQVDGGAGDDVQVVNGAPVGDVFTVAAGAASGDALFNRSNLVPFDLDLTAMESLVVNGADGADSVATEGLPGIVQDLDGGAPNTFPGDAIVVAGFAGDLSVTPIIDLPGAGSISQINFEFQPLIGPPPVGAPSQPVPALGSIARWIALVLLCLGACLALVGRTANPSVRSIAAVDYPSR